METTTQTATRGAIPQDTFRARLMLVRLHAGDLTIKQAAEKSGLNYGSWSNWERGGKPRDILDVADSISAAFGVDREWLLYGGQLAAEIRRRDRHGRRDSSENKLRSPHATSRPRSTHLVDGHKTSRSADTTAANPAPAAAGIGPRSRPSWTHDGVAA